MVKQRKRAPGGGRAGADDAGGGDDGGVGFSAKTDDCLTVSGYSRVRKKGDRKKRLAHIKAVLNMLTPKRAGPMSPGEIANGPQDKEGHAAGKGSLSPNRTFENGDGSKEFLSTGRTGRRNALPDILGRHAETDISDLPDRFEELTMETDRTSSGTEHDPNQPSTSKQHAG